MMILGDPSGGLFQVVRADGTVGTYDLGCSVEGSYSEDRPPSGRPFEGVVPTFCPRCFPARGGGPPEAPSRRGIAEAVAAIGGSRFRALTVGVANHVSADGRAPLEGGDLSAAPRHRLDICAGDVDGFYGEHSLDRALYCFQPRPGSLRLGHGASDIGEVLCYWHWHGDGGDLRTCALAEVRSETAADTIERYVADGTGSVSLSLGSRTLGRGEAQHELSVVLVPGRSGCHAEWLSSSTSSTSSTLTPTAVTAAMARHGFPFGNGPLDGALWGSPPGGSPEAEPPREELLEVTLNMLSHQRDILKLAKTRPGASNAERYINRGLRSYQRATGRLEPKLLTAAMSSNNGNGSSSSSIGDHFARELMALGMDLVQKQLNQQRGGRGGGAGGRRRRTDDDRSRSPPSRQQPHHHPFDRRRRNVDDYSDDCSDDDEEDRRRDGRRRRRQRGDRQSTVDVLAELKSFLADAGKRSSSSSASPSTAAADQQPSGGAAKEDAAVADLKSAFGELSGQIRDLASHLAAASASTAAQAPQAAQAPVSKGSVAAIVAAAKESVASTGSSTGATAEPAPSPVETLKASMMSANTAAAPGSDSGILSRLGSLMAASQGEQPPRARPSTLDAGMPSGASSGGFSKLGSLMPTVVVSKQ